MFNYEVSAMRKLMSHIIRQQVSTEVWNWLDGTQTVSKNNLQWNSAFAMIPRKTGRNLVSYDPATIEQLGKIRKGFSIEGWTIDRLCRVYLLISTDSSDKEPYTSKLENLFLCGEVSELAALYSSLPLLAYPAEWKNRCSEGIRSNIGTVLESIMYHNPFPAEQLDEKAWNQLVLKAIFTQKDLEKISGLHERANKPLADSLVDYANERRSAGRIINPQLWQLVGKFVDDQNFEGIARVFESEDPAGKKAILSGLSLSDYEPALALLRQHQDLLNGNDVKTVLSQNNIA
jgi:hypothetical protein